MSKPITLDVNDVVNIIVSDINRSDANNWRCISIYTNSGEVLTLTAWSSEFHIPVQMGGDYE